MSPPPTGSADAAPEPGFGAVAAAIEPWPADALHTEIGRRAETLRADPASRFDRVPASMPPGDGASAFPGLRRLGERLVQRLDRQIEALISGAEAIDDLDRQRLRDAADLSGPDAVGAIASALVAGFGIAPAIAPFAAAALCRGGAPARWSELAGRPARDALAALSDMTGRKP